MLKPYQTNVVKQLQASEHKGHVLGLNCGTGKTFIALSFLDPKQKNLVVVPARLFTQWTEEATKLKLTVNAYHGKGRNLDLTKSLTLTTMNTLIEDKKRRKFDFKREWDVLVVDESHLFKRMGTKSIKQPLYVDLFGKLQRQHTVAITGTPREHLQSALLALVREADFNKVCISSKSVDIEKYLPKATWHVEYIPHRQPAAMTALIDHVQELKTTAGNDLTLLSELRHWVHVARRFNTLEVEEVLDVQVRQDLQDLPKVVRLLSLLEKHPTGKIIIASEFYEVLAVVAKCLAKDRQVFFVHSEIPHTMRDTIFHDFREHATNPVLLITKSTGNTGLNLPCDVMVLLEPATNEIEDVQMTARALRLGSSRTVDMYMFVGKGIDRAFATRQYKNRKRDRTTTTSNYFKLDTKKSKTTTV